MNVAEISQLIGSLGFPIVACIALFISNYRQNESHKEESKLFSSAINNNTIAIEKMTVLLEEMQYEK